MMNCILREVYVLENSLPVFCAKIVEYDDRYVFIFSMTSESKIV